jgi:hypothetical protein
MLKKIFNTICTILLYAVLIKEISDHSNTVGMQILCVIALIAFIAGDIYLHIQRKLSEVV